MEANVLRLILLVTGVAFVLGIYLWERRRREGGRVHAIRREPEMSAQPLEEDELDELDEASASVAEPDFDLVEEGVRLRPSKRQDPPLSPKPALTKDQSQTPGQSERVPVPAWALKKPAGDALARELGQLDALVKETAPQRRPDAVAKEKTAPQQIVEPPRATPEMPQAPDAGEQIAFPFAAEDNRHQGKKKDKDKDKGKKKPRVEPEPPEFPTPLLPQLPPKILVINVVAKRAPFPGEALLEAAEACGLRPGDMNIFHLLDQASGGKTLFSMASMVEPGSFPVEDMGAFTTPGVSLFTQIPGPKDGLALFNEMLATAEHLAKCLGGEMQDETHSVLTRQTIEHLRGEIIEYQRRLRIAHRPA